MITLIGTGHVFDLSDALLTLFDQKQPEVIGVELDQKRYYALLARDTNPTAYQAAKKNLPVIYRLLAQFQENMAHEYGVNAGDEMLTAISYAQTHQIPVEFIDKDAQELFLRMWRTMPFFEKFKLLFSGFMGLFVSKKRVEQELKTYQNNFDPYIEEIGKKFPTIKRTLIDERNDYMIQQLEHLNTRYKHIVICIGDGHVPGISKTLQEKHILFETIRLHELQNLKKPDTDGTSGHFSIKYESL